METKKIKQLIESYFEGESSLAEEQQIKDFFKETDIIPKELEYAQSIFGYFADEKKVSLKKDTKKRNYSIIGISASLLIAATLIISNINTKNEIIYAYIDGVPVTDQEIAMQYTKQALLAVSENLDRGTTHLNQLNQLNEMEVQIKNKRK